jgi:DNA primase large subunit
MKITKRQLRRIIKEERARLLKESEIIQDLDPNEVLRIVESLLNEVRAVDNDLTRANRERGPSTTALVIRAQDANKGVLDKLQRLRAMMLGM